MPTALLRLACVVVVALSPSLAESSTAASVDAEAELGERKGRRAHKADRAPRRSDSESEPPPESDPSSLENLQDPDSAPFMQDPNGQIRPAGRLEDRSVAPKNSQDRRLALSVSPTYAALRVPMVDRPGPLRGGGAGVDVDVAIVKWLWFRASGQFSLHPLSEVAAYDEEAQERVVLAPAGRMSLLSGGIGLVYALDLGKVLPLVEAGLGAARVSGPEGVQRGQLGARCVEGLCEFGLACGLDNRCAPSPVPMVHAGLGVDWLVRRWLSIGAAVRYYAFLAEPSVFPRYLAGQLRLGVRF